MPTSPSHKRNVDSLQRSRPPRYLWSLIFIGILAALVVTVIALPASLVKGFLPPTVRAEDFSGNLWHGSSGKISVNSRDAGALEWRLHPISLLGFALSADLHWVKGGFVADTSASVDRHGLTARDAVGSGPIEDLIDLGIPAGWHGGVQFKFGELKLGFTDGRIDVLSVVGDLSVAGLTAAQFASGADLGGYELHLANGAITPDSDITAELNDTGGPIEVRAAIHVSAKDRTGLLTGTLRERGGAPAALHKLVENLIQMHARDAQGRVPVELEFTL